MRIARTFALALVLTFAVQPLMASPDAKSDAEIRHLLSFVAASGCTFLRNGDAHSARDASEHLAMKYGKARSRLATTEQFIEHVASKSFFTGAPYRVQCPAQQERLSSEWLRAELLAWRNAGTLSAATPRVLAR
jgi:hypothetical protein